MALLLLGALLVAVALTRLRRPARRRAIMHRIVNEVDGRAKLARTRKRRRGAERCSTEEAGGDEAEADDEAEVDEWGLAESVW